MKFHFILLCIISFTLGLVQEQEKQVSNVPQNSEKLKKYKFLTVKSVN